MTSIRTLAAQFDMEPYAVRVALDEQDRGIDEAFTETEAAEAVEVLTIMAEQAAEAAE